jgi:hypothetical protein
MEQVQTVKSELYNLIELLPSTETDKIISYIKFLISENREKDDYIRFIENSPEEEEKMSQETELDIKESLEEIRKGKYYTAEQIKAVLEKIE